MNPTSNQPPCGRSSFCFLCHLNPDSWTQIQALSLTVERPPKTLLFNEGAPPERLIAVCSGAVRLFSYRPDGSVKMFRIARAGEVLGLAAVLLNEPYAFSAETLEPGQLRILKRGAFLAVLDAEPTLWKQVALEGAQRHYETLTEVKKAPLVRLLELLLSFCGAFQEQKAERAPHRVRMTNQQIADLVGVSERMARNYLHKLRDKGLITREGRGLFVIDPQGLRNLLEKIQ